MSYAGGMLFACYTGYLIDFSGFKFLSQLMLIVSNSFDIEQGFSYWIHPPFIFTFNISESLFRHLKISSATTFWNNDQTAHDSIATKISWDFLSVHYRSIKMF